MGEHDAYKDVLHLPFPNAKDIVIADFEKRYLTDLLRRAGGNISAASRDAGLDRSNFRRMLRKHDINPSELCCGELLRAARETKA